jgi:four helix bundle protein
MQDIRKVRTIAQARVILKLTYKTTRSFPPEERYGITAQMRSAAFGIGSNIAEGCGRSSHAALRVSLDRAMGECSELEYQCLGCQDVEIGDYDQLERVIAETISGKKMLAKWIVYLRRRQHPKRGREGPSAK